MEWIEQLSNEDRVVLVFIRCYESARKQAGQFGYSAFRKEDETIVNLPLFKQFRTVCRWMLSKGWKVTFGEVHWQGYVKYVFDNLKPNIPQPGQLKNEVLLKRYLLSAPKGDYEESKKDLDALYRKIIRPEIVNRKNCMRLIGLEP